MKKALVLLIIALLMFTGCAREMSIDRGIAQNAVSYARQSDKTKNIPNYYVDPSSIMKWQPRLTMPSVVKNDEYTTASYFDKLYNRATADFDGFIKSVGEDGYMAIHLSLSDERLPLNVKGEIPEVEFSLILVDTELIREIIGILQACEGFERISPAQNIREKKSHVTFLMYRKADYSSTPHTESGYVSVFTDSGNLGGIFDKEASRLLFKNEEDKKRFEEIQQMIIEKGIEKYLDAYDQPANYPFV